MYIDVNTLLVMPRKGLAVAIRGIGGVDATAFISALAIVQGLPADTTAKTLSMHLERNAFKLSHNAFKAAVLVEYNKIIIKSTC